MDCLETSRKERALPRSSLGQQKSEALPADKGQESAKISFRGMESYIVS